MPPKTSSATFAAAAYEFSSLVDKDAWNCSKITMKINVTFGVNRMCGEKRDVALTLPMTVLVIITIGTYDITTSDNFHPYTNDIITQITKPIIRNRKWLTFSEMPSRIFSTSLQINYNVDFSHSAGPASVIKSILPFRITYSVARTAKLLLLPATSYHPISCCISDWKYLMRMRVIWRSAVLLKQSIAKIPAIN